MKEVEQQGSGDTSDYSFHDLTDTRDDVMNDSQIVGIVSEDSDSDLDDQPAEATECSSDEAFQPSLRSANGTLWSRVDHVNLVGRERSRNICYFNSGFKRGLHPASRKEAFEIFFNEVTDTAHVFSNRYGKRLAVSASKPWKPISRLEIEAFIGIHLIVGAYTAGHRNTEELWTETDGHPFFRATMSFERFKFITFRHYSS